jgi:hypothetical protein
LECALVLLAFSKLYEPDWIAFLKALFPTKKKGFENKKRKLFLVVLDVKILFLPFISLFFLISSLGRILIVKKDLGKISDHYVLFGLGEKLWKRAGNIGTP